jgi:hypothetical protein
MKHGFIAAAAVLAISAPALAQGPIPLHGGAAGQYPVAEVAQAQVPAFPQAAPSVPSPVPPPATQSEFPPPAPSPTYVWEPGHWSWNSVQYVWQPGRYVERPAVSASFVPGYWERQGNGWIWSEGRWDYPGIGSSTSPTVYPVPR